MQVDTSPIPDYLALTSLAGKSAIVLGAGAGIGRQTCHALAQAGAHVVCVDVDKDLAEFVASEVGGSFDAVDIRDRAGLTEVFASARAARPSIDVVIDIVGQARFGAFLDSTDEDWDWTFDMVLRHAFRTAQIAAPILAESDQGALTFVASISGLTSSPLHAAYGAAKAGLMSLVRTLCVEFADLGVRVNAVAPGPTSTPRMTVALGEEGLQKIGTVPPRRRMATPVDMAAALLFLSSRGADFINGQTLVVDGGGHHLYPYPMNFVSPG